MILKICLVSYTAPYTIPYIDIYLERIRSLGDECDIVFWDRDGNCKQEIIDGIAYHPYRGAVQSNQSRIKKYLQYLPATMYIRKFIKDRKYDRVVFLQTHVAVACAGILLNQYKGRYIVDIRDYTLENINIFRKIEKKVIDNSFATVISSRGYLAFLPEHEYVIAHNFTPVEPASVEAVKHRKQDAFQIRIAFIGNVRFYDMARKLLLLFKDDMRFHISYIGTGADALWPFCKENKITNIALHDRFSPSQTVEFYTRCDLINNLYGNHSQYLDYALSNKIYYAAQFCIPVLVSEETYSSKIAEEYGIGISWSPDAPDAANDLYKKYINFDKKRMEESSTAFLAQVIQENKQFSNVIDDFLRGL